MSSIGRRPVPRFGHGSRVPGWDDAVDLTKAPATVPDPARTPVPPGLRGADRGGDGQVPRPALGRDPGAARRPGGVRLVLARGDRPGGGGDAAHARVPHRRWRPSTTCSRPSPSRRNDVFVCTNISCSLLGADEFFEAMLAAAEGDPDVDVRSFECLGACDIAPMASVNGEYVGPLDVADAERIVEDLRAGRPVLEHKQLRYRRCADPIGTGTAAPDGGASEVAEEETDFGPPDRDTTRDGGYCRARARGRHRGPPRRRPPRSR